MCGGLVISYSAENLEGEKKSKIWPHLQYNAGRLISYTAIGAVLGGIGSFFAISPYFSGAVMILAAVFMVVMGLSFILDWQFLKRARLAMPKFLANYIFNKSETDTLPLAIGLLNGFMPCGPLQAMQLFALSSGSALSGGLSMAVFALGTMPMMFGLGVFISNFGKLFAKGFMKASGVLVIILGLIMFSRGLINFNIVLNPFGAGNKTTDVAATNFQTVNMDITYLGYQPQTFTIKLNQPVKWVINAKQLTGCSSAIMIEDLNIYQKLNPGLNVIEFTPTKIGELDFSCGMKMIWGKFIVS
jgi:sulfite exporter TauE/SafE